MSHENNPFAKKNPLLNLFCTSRKADGITHYVGFAYLENGHGGPGDYVSEVRAQIADAPKIMPTKSRGRPKKTPENVTFLAHCEMSRRLMPDTSSESDVRNEAMRVILKDRTFNEEPLLAESGTGVDKKRGLQDQLKKAREEIDGLRKCVCVNATEKVAFWLALESIPHATSDSVVIDSLGWLCFSGEKAEFGRIKWTAPASMFQR